MSGVGARCERVSEFFFKLTVGSHLRFHGRFEHVRFSLAFQQKRFDTGAPCAEVHHWAVGMKPALAPPSPVKIGCIYLYEYMQYMAEVLGICM